MRGLRLGRRQPTTKLTFDRLERGSTTMEGVEVEGPSAGSVVAALDALFQPHIPAAAARSDSMAKRLSVFTHWVVNTEPHIHEMVDWLWTNSQIFAVISAEGADGPEPLDHPERELVLCTDQAGWDMLRDGFARRSDVDLGSGQ